VDKGADEVFRADGGWSGQLENKDADARGTDNAVEAAADAADVNTLAAKRALPRRYRRNRIVLVALAVLALIAAVVTGISTSQRHSPTLGAEQRSTRLIADARELGSDPGLAVQLAVAAYRSSPSRAAADLLYSMLDQPTDSVVATTHSQTLRVATQAKGSLAAATSADGNLRIWKLADGTAPVLETTIHAIPTAVALAPTRPLLAGPCRTPALCLWNLSDPRHPVIASQLPSAARGTPGAGKAGITSMAVSPDGTLLAAAKENGYTVLWSIADPAHPRFLASLANPVHVTSDDLAGVAFDPRGGLLATTLQNGGTKLWDVSDPARPASVATINTGYQAVAFSPDGSMLAAGGDTKIGLWRLADRARPAPISVQSACTANPKAALMDIQTVAFSPDGSRLSYSGSDASTTDNRNAELCLLDTSPRSLDSGSPVAVGIPTGFGIISLAYTPRGVLVTGGPDGVIRQWRPSQQRVGGLAPTDSMSWTVSPSGRLLAAPIEEKGLQALYQGTSSFGVWDISVPAGPTLDAVVRIPAAMIQFIGPAVVLTVDQKGAVRLWDLRDPHHPVAAASLGRALVSAAKGYTFSGEVTSDTAGDLVAVLGGDARLHLWRVTRGPHAKEVGSVPATDASQGPAGILGDGRSALIVTSAGIQWWNISDPAHPVRGAFSPLSGANKGMGQSADTLMAAANAPGSTRAKGTLDLFDVADGRLRSSVTLSRSAASQLALAADARLLATTADADDILVLWGISEPGHPRRLAALTVPNIQGIAFDPSKHLMADWNASTVQLWDIGKPAAPLLRASFTPPSQQGSATGKISTAQFTASGKTLLVAAGDSVFPFDANPAALANRLCSSAGSPITPAQWRRYAPGVPYQNPCPR
jgi:WD40 repeat protein